VTGRARRDAGTRAPTTTIGALGKNDRFLWGRREGAPLLQAARGTVNRYFVAARTGAFEDFERRID